MNTAEATTVATAQSARPRISLLAGRHKRVRAGHPWIFSNEVDMSEAVRGLAPGTLVEAALKDSPVSSGHFFPGWSRRAFPKLRLTN